jgi:molybdopterin-guanine dinucleotide biosynthesis protein
LSVLRFHIVAPWSGAGKTLLICRLLPYLPGWGTIKVSLDRGDGHRHGPPGIVEPSASHDRPGSDTARHREAGSVRTLWVRASPHTLGRDLRDAVAMFEGLPGALIEGNAAWSAYPGDRLLLVTGNERRPWKRSVTNLAEDVDIVIVHGVRAAVEGDIVHRRVPARVPRLSVDLRLSDSSDLHRLAETVLTWTRP